MAPPLKFTPQGVVISMLENLPDDLRSLVESEQYIKPWKNCKTCGRRARHFCKHCGHVRSYDKTRYCDRSCQRRDWSRHQADCDKALDSNAHLIRQFSGLQLQAQQVSFRQTERWLNALTLTIAWGVSQAFQLCTIKNRRDLCLYIDMVRIVPRSTAPLWPKSFEFRNRNWATEPTRQPGDESRSLGFYSLSINGSQVQEAWVPIEAKAPRELAPQWPWMLAQSTLMGDINPEISMLRQRLVHTAIVNYPVSPDLMREFNAGGFTGRFELTEDSVDRWMTLMYPVTAHIGSRFHYSFEYAKEKYGHLLFS